MSETVHGVPGPADETPLNQTPAAKRALAEAEQRRLARQMPDDGLSAAKKAEIGGPAGPEPVRYGDWEKGGIAWDF